MLWRRGFAGGVAVSARAGMEFAAFKGLGLGDSLVLRSDDCLQISIWGRDTEDRTKASAP